MCRVVAALSVAQTRSGDGQTERYVVFLLFLVVKRTFGSNSIFQIVVIKMVGIQIVGIQSDI